MDRSYPLEARRWSTDAEWDDMADFVLPLGDVERGLRMAFRGIDHRCEYCGAATIERYCDDDCRSADKSASGPKACAWLAGGAGYCDWHDRPAEECARG